MAAKKKGDDQHGTRDTDMWSLHEMPTMPPQVITIHDRGTDVEAARVAAASPGVETTVDADGSTVVTLVLPDAHVFRIDALAAEISARSGVELRRAEIVRALLSGILDTHADLASVRSENELRALVRRLLRPTK